MGADVRLYHDYQAEYGLRGYGPGTNDRFLLARILLNLNLKLEQLCDPTGSARSYCNVVKNREQINIRD